MRFVNSAAILVLMLVCLPCIGAPEPALVQGPGDWTVDVKFEHLRQIELRSGRGSAPMRFWYVILTVTNNTGRDVEFYPKCELMTDTFQIVPAGSKTPAEVFKHIKKRHDMAYPFLEALKPSGVKLLEGEDNTRDIAIVWPDFDSRAKGLKLFISGLSSETAMVEIPSGEDQSKKVFLRKTLELDYAISGDPKFRSIPKLSFEGEGWVMR